MQWGKGGRAGACHLRAVKTLQPRACVQYLEDCSEHLGSPQVNWALQVNSVLELLHAGDRCYMCFYWANL